MLVNFKTDNLDLTDEIREYAELKVGMLGKLLHDADEEALRYDVELAKGKENSGNIYRADIIVHAAPLRVHAVGHGESVNAAIDGAKDELERRLRREKTKGRAMLRKGKAALKKMLRWG